jgi:hypothetical protein
MPGVCCLFFFFFLNGMSTTGALDEQASLGQLLRAYLPSLDCKLPPLATAAELRLSSLCGWYGVAAPP